MALSEDNRGSLSHAHAPSLGAVRPPPESCRDAALPDLSSLACTAPGHVSECAADQLHALS